MKRHFVFRVNYDDAHEWILKELHTNKYLRQGWGKTNFQLVEKDGTTVSKEAWRNRYKTVWDDPDDEVNKRYDILIRMLEISEGDLIVIPKTTDWSTFTICEAAGSYFFDHESDTFWDDFKHVIPIRNLKNYKYRSSAESTLISSKFKAYQSAVNNIWQQSTFESIEVLFKKQPSDVSKTIKQITDELSQLAIRPIADKFLNVDPNLFEDIIAECLKCRGYEIISKRLYDGKGADVDIVASFSLPYFSDITDLSPTLYIQIKKKKGNDWNDIKGVDQLINSGKDSYYPIKILINTADSLSDVALEKAAMHGIKVISGLRIIDFILKSPLGMELEYNLGV